MSILWIVIAGAVVAVGLNLLCREAPPAPHTPGTYNRYRDGVWEVYDYEGGTLLHTDRSDNADYAAAWRARNGIEEA